MSHALRLHRQLQQPSGANAHLDFFKQPGVELFCDQYGRAHVRFPLSDHLETHPLRGKRVLNTLIRFYAANGARLNRRQAKAHIDFAEAYADVRSIELTNRSGWGTSKFELWIDQTDALWGGIRVVPGMWEVVAHPPTMFHRFVHQCPLPTPDPSGDIRDLLDHMPQLGGEQEKLLFLAWVVTAWVPIPRPILALIGTHGAAKSTMTTFIRRLLDPSRAELLGKDARGDLPLTFHKHAVAAFDNVDALAAAEADLFCQAVTGRGIARRQLYTDADEFILSLGRMLKQLGETLADHGVVVTTLRRTTVRRVLIAYDPAQDHLGAED